MRELKSSKSTYDNKRHNVPTKKTKNFEGVELVKTRKNLRNALKNVSGVSTQPIQKWGDIDYVKEYLQKLRSHYDIKEGEWHLISTKHIRAFNGGGLIAHYKSYRNALRHAYPELEINIKEYQDWKNYDYVRDYLYRLRIHYGRSEAEWNLITTKQIVDFGGGGLLKRYKTFHNALVTVYPGIETGIQQLQNWSNLDYVREYLQKLRVHKNLKENEWHLITTKDINKFHGRGLLSRYKTFHNVLSIAYPDLQTKIRPNLNWNDLDFVRGFLQKLLVRYKRTENEWHLITTKQILSSQGHGLIQRFGTFRNALETVYPGIKIGIRKQDWSNITYVRDYLQKLRVHYHKTEEEWHLITDVQIREFKGAGLLKRYRTFHRALQLAYPGIQIQQQGPIKWEERKPNKFWNDTENIKLFVKSLESRLLIKQPQDWYRVSQRILRDTGGQGLINRTRSLFDVLKMCYPEVPWDETLLSKNAKKSEQFFLRNLLMHIFPTCEIIEDYLHPDLSFVSGWPMEIDLFIPEKNLGFEYQGIQHYRDHPYFGPLELYQQRDQEKQNKCRKVGIHLVPIPFSWSRTKEDLQARIAKVLAE